MYFINCDGIPVEDEKGAVVGFTSKAAAHDYLIILLKANLREFGDIMLDLYRVYEADEPIYPNY